MTKKRIIERTVAVPRAKRPDYPDLLGRISGLLEQARRATVRITDALLTAAYWEIGRQIVEFEQGGSEKADYGGHVIDLLALDLTAKYGRGFSRSNLFQIRALYLGWQIVQTPSGQFTARVKCQTVSGESGSARKVQTPSAQLQPVRSDQLTHIQATLVPGIFPLPWSHDVRLMSVKDDFARWFYEDEAIVAGWSVRQLDRMSR